MKMFKIVVLIALLGAFVLYYQSTLGTYKQSIENYSGK